MSRWPVPTYPKSSPKPKQKTIIGPSLYKWQMDTVKLYQDHPTNSILTISSPRQRGKTMLMQTIVVMEAVNHPGWEIYIVLPSYITARKIYKELMRMLTSIPGLVKSSSAQFFDIELTNGSQICLRSIGSGDALRGATANLLMIDEAAFIDLETAIETVFPYVNSTNGDIILTSTPKLPDRETNLFAKFYFEGLEGQPGCYTINWGDYDTSALMPPEKLKLYEKTIPFSIFQNEFLGLFLDLKNELWDIEPVLQSGPGILDPGSVMGVDWATGTKNDETVLTVFNSEGQMCRLSHFNDKSPTDTVKFLLNQLESMPQIKRVGVETNSIGKVYLDQFKKGVAQRKLKVQIIPFETTNSSKREIIESLQLEIANQTIGLLNENKLKTQFAGFTMKSTPSGLITYENETDVIGDDVVMSVAIARHTARKSGYILR